MQKKFFIVLGLVAMHLILCGFETGQNEPIAEEGPIFISTEKEIKMGESLAKQVEKKFKPVEDENIQKRIDEVGQKIATACDRREIDYFFKVIEDDKMNAFSLPGGYVYVCKKMYDKLTDDGELASVLAHEVGHIVARHGVKRLQTAIGMDILVFIGAMAEENKQNVAKADLALTQLMMAYSREDELLADKLSVKYVKDAGYNPEAVVSFLEKLQEYHMKEEPLKRYSPIRSHPYLSIRIARAKQEVRGKMDFIDYINVPTESER